MRTHGRPTDDDQIVVGNDLLNRLLHVREAGKQCPQNLLDAVHSRAIGKGSRMVDDVVGGDVIQDSQIAGIDDVIRPTLRDCRVLLLGGGWARCGRRCLLRQDGDTWQSGNEGEGAEKDGNLRR
jgi:hypothetical protein